jgi:hypothetical protein
MLLLQPRYFRDCYMGSMTRDRFVTYVFAGWMSIFGFSCHSHFNAGAKPPETL